MHQAAGPAGPAGKPTASIVPKKKKKTFFFFLVGHIGLCCVCVCQSLLSLWIILRPHNTLLSFTCLYYYQYVYI